MRLLYVADCHYALKQFDWLLAESAGYSAVLIGGDLLDLSSPLELDVQIVVTGKYLDRLRRQVPVLVCSGNHDLDQRDASEERVARWLGSLRGEGLFVDGDRVELEGVVVSICPWWDGPESRARVAAQLERDAPLAGQRWLWVHHAPPDASPVSWNGRKHVGDAFLPALIGRLRPWMVLSGHVHDAPFSPEGSWISRVESTWVVNPGRQPGPWPAFLMLDTAAMTAEWVAVYGQDSRRLEET